MTPGAFLWLLITIRPDGNATGPPTPVHPLSLEMSCHNLEADPCPPFFRKNLGDPYLQEECRPVSISGKADSGKVGGSMRIYARAYAYIYVYRA